MTDRRNQPGLPFEALEFERALEHELLQGSDACTADTAEMITLGGRRVEYGSMEHFDLMRQGFTEDET